MAMATPAAPHGLALVTAAVTAALILVGGALLLAARVVATLQLFRLAAPVPRLGPVAGVRRVPA